MLFRSEIADSIGMNESSLSRLFKNETGVNLNYYINEKKMKKAMELLRGESSMIKDVAAAVGMLGALIYAGVVICDIIVLYKESSP